MANTRISVDVTPSGTASAYVAAPFDEGKKALEDNGYKIISLQENARLRMQEGVNKDISLNGNWVMEGVLYVPNKGIYLTKKSPIMANAKDATGCHRRGKEFYLTNKQVEEALSDSVALTGDSIPTNKFAENPVTVYAFGDDAEKYGQFLNDAGINAMPVWLASLEEKAFARQMWFARLVDDNWSVPFGHCRYLSYGNGMRGVRRGSGSAEGAAKNVLEAYSPEQISTALKDLGFGGLEESLLGKLKQ